MPKSRDDTFILYYWNEYEEFVTDNPSCLYCLSESTIQLCLSALRFAGWPTRWRLNGDDTDNRLRDREIWNQIDGIVALAHKELTVDMSCDLQAGFQTLADAIVTAAQLNAAAQQPCNITVKTDCGGCGTAGANTPTGVVGTIPDPTTGEPIPIFGTQPTLSVTPGEFPEGYDNEEDYLNDKCALSHLIVDGLIGSLRGLGALGVFNYIALAGLIVLAVTGAIIFPPAFIPIAAALLGALAGGVTVLTLAANEIESNKDDWVCALYKGDSVNSIISTLADLIDGIVATLSLGGIVGNAVKQIILLLVNGDTLNQLFTKTAHLNYPNADCTCFDCVDKITYNYPADGEGDWTLSGYNWDGGAMGGMSVAWQEVFGQIRAEELFTKIGYPCLADGIRIRGTVQFSENANTNIYCRITSEETEKVFYYASGSNGYGFRSYDIDLTYDLASSNFVSLQFGHNGNSRDAWWSNLIIDIPCSSVITN